MKYRVVVTPIANAEAMEAFGWYAARSQVAAEKWFTGLARALERLADHPERCPVSEEDSAALDREVRMLLYGRRRGVFRILHAISGDAVLVLRIRHGAQGPINP